MHQPVLLEGNHHMEIETRLCPKCGEVKTLSEFTRDRSKKSGYHGYCKKCNYLRLKDKLGSDHYRRYRKEWELQHRYGMTSNEYTLRVAEQGGSSLSAIRHPKGLLSITTTAQGKLEAFYVFRVMAYLGWQTTAEIFSKQQSHTWALLRIMTLAHRQREGPDSRVGNPAFVPGVR